jgi:hypothetical protein
MLEFARQGGLVITRRGWAADGGRAPGMEHTRYQMSAIGKGRLAVSREESPDPFLVARDAHMLLDRTNDMLRLYNTSTAIARLTTADDGKTDLLQFVVYARRDPRDPITVWLRDPRKTARLWKPADAAPEMVKAGSELGGIAVQLPSVAICAAVELS